MAANWWDSYKRADDEEKWWESYRREDDTTRDAGAGRGFVNPPTVYEPQPVRPAPAPAPAANAPLIGNAMGDDFGSAIMAEAAPPPPPEAKPQPKQAPYKNRLEALDDAVNLVEEGAPLKRVAQSFSQIGISEGDIISHGVGRKSPMFQAPEMSRRQIEQYVKPEQQPIPQGTGEIKPVETSLAEDAINLGKRVGARTRQSATNTLFQVGAINQDEAARLFAQDQRKAEAAAPPESVQEGLRQFGEAKTFTDAAVALATNPKATFVALTESLLQTAPAMALAVTRVPALMRATGIGVTSGALEFGSAMADVLGDKGVDLTNAAAISDALNKPEVRDEIREKGAKRGLTIGAIDALTAGFAGKFLAPVQEAIYAGKMSEQAAKRATLGAWGKELGMQVAGGAGGEALAQQLTGEFKPADILLEGFGEAVTGPLEARGNLRESKALSPSAQIAREIDAAGRAFDQVGPAGSQAVAIDMLRTEPGTSNLITPAATVANFTPPDSPTKRAGLVDIEVPIPGAESAAPLGPINPTTEQQFGLDKLRMGGADVGTAGALGDLAGGGGVGGGGVPGGGLDVAGRGAGAATGGAGGAAVDIRADGGPAVPPGGAAGEQAPGLTTPPPAKIWAGRAGDGYVQPEDAQQALPKLQSRYPDLTWNLQKDADGKYFWAGTTKAADLGAQATAAQSAPGGEAVAGTAAPGATAAAAAPSAANVLDLQSARLRLAPTAPIKEITSLNTALQREAGVTFTPVTTSEMTDQHKLASSVARLLGKTLTVVRQESGDALAMPNGMINRLGGKHIFIAENTDDAPLFVTIHEAYHGLPAERRKALNTALLDVFKQDMKGEFLREFNYTPDKFDEEAPAMIAQAVSKRADFWEQVRDKMGNKEFGEVAKVILSKLNEVITGARKQYGEDFVGKYITNVEKARDLLSTAYAESMQAQGLKADTAVVGEAMAASQRSRIGMDFKDVIKRTPELQEGMAKLQAGEITKEDYARLVDQYKPVEPYTSVPAPVTPDAAKFALANGRGQSEEKAAKFGLPSQEMKAGEPAQLRLDIPSYSEHGAWVVSVHRPEGRSFGAGKVVGYEPVASVQNAEFGMLEKSAAKIAAGANKGTIATIMGDWKPTTPAEAKLKADQALKSKDWVQVGMDPERHSYFYDRATMEPVVKADEVIQIGPLVLAKNPTYGEKSDFMFSTKAREPVQLSDYKPATDNFNKQRDMSSLLKESVPQEVISQADNFVAQYYKERAPVSVSPEDRLRAEILLRPKMQQATEAKAEYDQKVLNIAARTGAVGQMLAPIKGLKRAAEKLAVEEKFNVDNIKDLLRSTIVVDSYEDAKPIVDEIRKEFKVLRIKNRSGISLTGDRVESVDRQRSGGYADVLINIQMPNGTTGEIQINTPAMLAAKDDQGHKLYEAAREQPEGSPKQREIYDAMRGLYDAAFLSASTRQSAAQAMKAPSEIGAPLRGSSAATSSSPVSASLKTEPSGNLTNSSPENEATNEQPSGNLAGNFIAESPDTPNISQELYASNKAKKAGDYTYTTDDKGRITVAGDAQRIRFLTKKVANSVVTDAGVRFKAEDAKAAIKVLKAEPKVDSSIGSEVAGKLALTPQELASTSLEYQTGLPKDRAFVAPLKVGIPEVVQFLEQRRRASGLKLLDIAKPEDQRILAKLIAAETLAAIRASGNALQWYDETIGRTLAMAAVKYPELATDQNAQMVFRVAMAITSQGLNVEDNLKFTMEQYDAFRKSAGPNGVGKFPEVGKGEDLQAMAKNFALVNELLVEMGPDTLRRFLVTPFTVGELRSAGFEPEGELADESVLGSSVLGPKIGFGFYSNLNGNFEPVTMDMWFMRTIGRLTGYLRSFDAEKFSNQLKRFRDSLNERGTNGVFADSFDQTLVERARTDEGAAVELARQVKKAHEKDFKDNRQDFDAGTRQKSQLVYAADTMITSLDKPKDVPGNGSERRQLREVVRQAVALVEQSYGQRIPPAAMQALIWYPEQELYKAMGVKLRVTSQDYAGATEKVLTEEGYDGKRLRAAAKSGSRGAQQKAGGNVAAGNQAAGTATGQAGPLEGAERERFLRARYERTELAKEQAAPKRKGIVFEVAPDPNNERLTAAWRNLSAGQRMAISERVAREIVPRVLKEFDTDGIITPQVGSYLDDTNPSFTLLLNKGDVVEVAKALGFALAQDSMMVVSPKEFKGGEKNSALALNVGDKTSSEIDQIYQKLREIEVNGEKIIGGQSYANGYMTVLNFSSVPTSELAILVDQKLNKAYSILTREVFAAFPEKKDYDYASAANDGRGSRADLRRRARDLRAEATSALEQELSDAGIQFSNRANAAGGGRNRGVGSQDVRGQATPSYGTPREGSSSAVGYHYSTQPRTNLSSGMYGTGLRGAEMQRLEGADSRLRQRVYFYIDRGTGITPEAGVGGYAHRVDLRNLYDADEDPLRLQRDASDFNAFEAAVIDAGFDGYMVRNAGPSGNAVLLGRHAVPVEQLGQAGRMETGDVVPAARERVLSDAEKIAANKMLPAGQVSGKRWGELISRGMPDVYERLADSPVWQSDKVMYRSELAKALRDEAAAPMFSNREQRQLPAVSSQQALNRDISDAAELLRKAVVAIKAGQSVPKIMLGRLPHVLNMLGARTQDFDIASSIVKKIFVEKHEDDFGDVTALDFVRAMYRPAMVLKSKDGVAREYELVLSITGKRGPLLVPIKVSANNTDPFGAVMSAYQKQPTTIPDADKIANSRALSNDRLTGSGWKTIVSAEMPDLYDRLKDHPVWEDKRTIDRNGLANAIRSTSTITRRINDGNLIYIDPSLAKQALTGRKRGDPKSDAKLNDSFVSWASIWPKLQKMVSDRTVKTDVNLMKWIGDNYKPSSSDKGWEDAPAFSNRATALELDKDVVALFRDLEGARGLGRIRVQERVDAHPLAETITKIDSEFLDILDRLESLGLVNINCK